jgi:LmbE family N-acetylglucosaminyl deacetylase
MLNRRPEIDLYVPDGESAELAARRTTHLGIGAHPDDLEIIGFHGIAACYDSEDSWFTGVVVCDGAGSPRSGPYANYSDAEMAACRRQEQRRAASLGQYSLQLQLGFSSAAVKAGSEQLIDDLVAVLESCRPTVLYLHNPADAHATHRATLRACIAALRRLDPASLPRNIYGIEVWRSLDWLPSALRTALPISDPNNLQARLLGCHDSQIQGGKRYDEAFVARQRANATLVSSHAVDAGAACVLAMNLNALAGNTGMSERDWLAMCLERFAAELLDDPD